ncbi:PI-PLC X domain-containing protein 1-like [Dama dama]|uniref:PI-PLC X domain-containing protein 1-like n=1 Tax=Dama dama TaxID=30532 RepID=UPI002A361727|nr:PI-PLC X domain-containing protein 1-like [Dama dama]
MMEQRSRDVETGRLGSGQVLSIMKQLDAGREDLQMVHTEEGTEGNLHPGHMVYTMALVENALTEISEWLENHPQEVVILACRNSKGMMEDLHEYLMGCIKNIFGDMLCFCGEVPTLCQPWSRGQQVILSYKDEESMSQHAELWPGIPYWWGNQVKHLDLVHYLEHMKSCSHPASTSQRNCTLSSSARPGPWLHYLCAWVRGQCPGSAASYTNTIAGDFIWALGLVGDVIKLNRKLLRG